MTMRAVIRSGWLGVLWTVLLAGCTRSSRAPAPQATPAPLAAVSPGPTASTPTPTPLAAPAPSCRPFATDQGCASLQCPQGTHCVENDAAHVCSEAHCSCDASGEWICTADCVPRATCQPD